MRVRFASILSAAVVFGFFQNALAADLPVKAPLTIPSAYNWGGWYVGGNIGYGWGASSDPALTFVDAPALGLTPYYAGGGNVTPNVSPHGVIGGGQVGFNWMVSPHAVAGLVADFQGAGVKASAVNTVSVPAAAVSTQSNSVRTDWFGTVRAKLGWVQNNWMAYATGGVAYGHVRASGTTAFATAPALTFTGSNTTTKFGWTAGAGLDYGLARNWIVGLEYLYVDLGTVSYTETPNILFPTSSITISNRAAMHIGRLTVNYRF